MKPAFLLETVGLMTHFRVRDPASGEETMLRAVDGVDLKIRPGEIHALVGESGCGKSTLGKTLMGLVRPTDGAVVLEGRDIAGLGRRARRPIRRKLQYVYQDPGASLDPRWTIGRSLEEPLAIHDKIRASERRALVKETIAAVGLREEHLDLYPHELSGGQLRRVGLARILTLRPKLVILDEPTSGLDVSVQATILKLLLSLRERFDLTYLFVSHDLGVVRMISDRVSVMYLGRIVETGETVRVFKDPRHPYTRSLLAAVPTAGKRHVLESAWLEGEPPDPMNLPAGCRFRNRCPVAAPVCAEREPPLAGVSARQVACHMADGDCAAGG